MVSKATETKVMNTANAMVKETQPCEKSSFDDSREDACIKAIAAVRAKDYYSHVECEHFREFLENNTLDTVYDLEDDPTIFKHVYMNTNVLIEFDERL